MAQTLYWHDYETFGTDPRRDRAAQFAGVRTDYDLNVIGEPLVIYCRPAADYLPQPDACVVTGITPQEAEQKDICEAGFIDLIHRQLARPQTCTVGYNNIRFDDEVTRNLLYRNFFDPYAREWQNGNSRWDLIDLTRAARALRSEGIQWPDNEEGRPSFRLEELTAANGISHAEAHDALSDVHATIAFARLLRKAQPKLYAFIFSYRLKAKTLELLQLGSMRPVLHVSGMYPSTKGCIAVVVALCQHPENANGIVVYDLSVDPEPLLDLSAEQIRERLYTRSEDLPEDTPRIPLKTVYVNKCPVLAPMAVLRPQDAERLQIDPGIWQGNLEKIKARRDLAGKLTEVFSAAEFPETHDPDLMLYSGGFFSDADRAVLQRIRETPVEKLAALHIEVRDPRIPEMLFRYRGRNYPETLQGDERQRWLDFCLRRLSDPKAGASIVIEDYEKRLQELQQQQAIAPELLQALWEFGRGLLEKAQKTD